MSAGIDGAPVPESTAGRIVGAQPVLFVIDDDAGVVQALRDDLGRRFGGRSSGLRLRRRDGGAPDA
jgi:hypothetical protein